MYYVTDVFLRQKGGETDNHLFSVNHLLGFFLMEPAKLQGLKLRISFTSPPPYITRYTMSLLEKKIVGDSFIFISYWIISHAILEINWSRHNYRHFLLALIIKIFTQPIRSAVE